MSHPKLYRRKKEVHVHVPLGDFPNEYSRKLIYIGQQLTNEDFSCMKLLLQTNKVISVKNLDILNNSMELMAFLDKRSFITEQNLSFLDKTLRSIGRLDLIKYTSLRAIESTHVLSAQPSSAVDTSSQEDTYTKLKNRGETTCSERTEADCMDDDGDLPSSQGSMTDDDKMLMI